MIKFLVLVALTLNVFASTKIKDNVLKVGKEDSQDIYIYGNNGSADAPFLLYDFSEGVWKQSNDGTTIINIGEGAGTFVDLTTNQTIAGEKTFTEAMLIQDNATPLSPLFRILSNDLLTNYFSVESTGLSSDLDMTFNSTGALTIPVGDISERPTGVTGMTRYNSEEECLELYNGTEWFCAGVGGGGSAGINFLVDASFENEDLLPDATVGGTQTYPAYTIDSELYSEFNELYYNNAYTGLSASDFYVRDSFARTNYSQKDGLFSLYYKITSPGLNDVQLCLRVDDSDYSEACQSSYLVTLKTNGEWNKVEIPFVYGSSTVEYEIFNESFTGDITVALDNIYIGTLPDGYIQQVGQAHFVGKANLNTNCRYRRANNVYGIMLDIDSTCSATSIDGQLSLPTNTNQSGIKIENFRTDGWYDVKFQGLLYNTANSGQCFFSLSKTGNYEGNGMVFVENSGVGGSREQNQLYASVRFEQGDTGEVFIINRNSISTNCDVYAEAIGAAYTVNFYPDSNSTIVSQDTELTAKTANELSAVINMSTNTVTSSNYDWIDSVSTPVTGDLQLDISSLGLSNVPSCTCLDTQSGANTPVDCADDQDNPNTTSTLYFTLKQNTSGVDISNVQINCSKQGADVNKNQTIIGKFEQIDSTPLCQVIAVDNDGDVLTADTEDIPFKTELKDNCNAWSNVGNTGSNTNDAFTAQKNGMVSVSINSAATTSSATALDIYEDNVFLYRCSVVPDGTNQKGFSCKFEAIKDSVYTFRFNNSFTLATPSPKSHIITITELPDTASIVKNLNDLDNRTNVDQYSETEITWGLWNGQQLYRRCFTVASDITSNNLTYLNFGSGLSPINSANYFSTFWIIDDSSIDLNNIARISYDSSTGNIRVETTNYKYGTGSSFCMDYTK